MIAISSSLERAGGRPVLPRHSFEELPDYMIVCSCNVLSDGQVRGCLDQGAGCPRTAAQVYQCLGCSPKCGRCARTIRGILAAALLGDSHTCSTTCAAACPLAKAVEHGHPAEPVLEPAFALAV